VKREIQVKDKKVKMTLAPYSFQVFRVKIAGKRKGHFGQQGNSKPAAPAAQKRDLG
jgi:hypothetical protein